MALKPQSPSQLIFGPFEVVAEKDELLRNGVRVRLARQPYQILLSLLAQPGQVVTREELRAKIWGDTTFVDFEHSLNTAVSKLRRALDDSAERPQFIQTVPGRGYQFIGTMQDLGTEGKNVDSSPVSIDRSAPLTETDYAAQVPTPDTKLAKSAWLVGFTALAAAVAVSSAIYLHRPAGLTETDTIVLADFRNSTGDTVFDETLRQGLIVQLQQSPFLSLVSDEHIQRALHLMARPANSKLTPELARDVCERMASTAVLDGLIARMGDRYVIGITAKSCSTGEILDQEQVQAANKEEVLDALSQIAVKLRRRLGESLASVKRYSVPLAEATTPSLKALKMYSTAARILSLNGSAAALPVFQRAIEIDPNFAMAHAYLGRMYGDLGETGLSLDSSNRAWLLRDRASDQERFFITASYEAQVTGNLEKAQRNCELWVQAYPRDRSPHNFLSGLVHRVHGNYQKSIDEGREAIRLDPDFAIQYRIIADDFVSLGRFTEAEEVLSRAAERKLDIPTFSSLRYDIAFLKHDLTGMEHAADLAQEKTGTVNWIANHQALALEYSGRWRDASLCSRLAADWAIRSEQPETAALVEVASAIGAALFGKSAEALKTASRALELSKGRDAEYGAAFALARLHDPRSEVLADDLERRFSDDSSVRFSYLPVLKAVFALNRNDPAGAIKLLEPAIPYELGKPRCSIHGFFGALYPIYVRGEAKLAAHQGAAAAVEFKKIIDHPGIVIGDPIGSLAWLQMARALALASDTEKSLSAYQDFLRLWKEADTDIPVFGKARMEYANLVSRSKLALQSTGRRL